MRDQVNRRILPPISRKRLRSTASVIPPIGIVMARGRPVAYCLAWLMPLLGPVPAHASEPPPQIDPSALAAWARYEQFSRHLRGSDTQTTTNRLTGAVRLRKRDFSQNEAGALLRWLSAGGPDDEERVIVQNGRYCFEARGSAAVPGQYLLRAYSPKPDGLLPSAAQPVRAALFVEMNPHFCFADRPLSECFTATGLRLVSATRTPTPAGERYRVEFDGKYTLPNSTIEKQIVGHLMLDPANMWAITSSQYHEDIYLNGKKTGAQDHTVTHVVKSHPSGHPIIAERLDALSGMNLATKQKQDYAIHSTYDVSVNGDPGQGPYLLTAFGLPEPVDQPLANRPRTALWLVLAGALLGVLAVAFDQLRRRSRAGAVG